MLVMKDCLSGSAPPSVLSVPERCLKAAKTKEHLSSIANRGEIACRIIRTARAMGIRTIAVYSDADANALHVRMADDAVHIGASAARESYLVGEKIIAAPSATGAEAIHPGYGFLSENAEFAQRGDRVLGWSGSARSPPASPRWG
jgi:pyruvate carboxylase